MFSNLHIPPYDSSTKIKIKNLMLAAFRRWKDTHNGSEEDCINKVKGICRAPKLGGPPLKCNEVLQTRNIREELVKTKTPSASFAYILQQAPDPDLSDRLMTELVWPKEVKFPYGLSQGITTANPTSDIEDEKSDDD